MFYISCKWCAGCIIKKATNFFLLITFPNQLYLPSRAGGIVGGGGGVGGSVGASVGFTAKILKNNN